MRAKVLLYVPCLNAGGTEKRVERIARGLNPSRFQVTVAWSHVWGPVGERLQDAGMAVRELPLREPLQAEAILRELAPDVFHSFSYSLDARDTEVASAAGVPVIVTSRVNARDWDAAQQIREWETVRNRVARRITAVSQAAASVCERIEGVSRQNIAVIPNGVVLPPLESNQPTIREELGLPDDVLLLGYVANYRPEKAHPDLLRAFRTIADAEPRARLLCCGIAKPEIRVQLQDLLRELDLEAKVHLLDSRADVDPVYRALDLYVHSSLAEGSSNAVLEAMSYALPVVATAAGGTPEAVIDGVTGLLVPVAEPAALAASVLDLLGDAERRTQFGQAGRERAARHFSQRAMLSGYERLYEDVLHTGIEPRPLRAFSNGRIRILLHADYLWLGGLEKRIANLVLRLDRNRFDPVMSWHRRLGASGELLERAGIPVVRIEPSHADRSAVEQIRELAPDIFHSFSCRKSSADVMNARAAGVPVVVTSRGGVRSLEEPPHAWELERNQWTDRVITGSRAIANAAQCEGLDAEKITVIHNGVELATPAAHRDRVMRIGYAATYRALKAHEVLLIAFREIARRFPEITLLCCGETYDSTKQRLESLATQWSLTERVQFLDVQADMDSIYRRMDIYVHPSLSEGFSNAILEAMARGLPVIASNTGGNPEAVIDGVTGLLVPPDDPVALECAIAKLVEDGDLRRNLGRAAFDRASSFSMRAMVDAHQSVYQDLIETLAMHASLAQVAP